MNFNGITNITRLSFASVCFSSLQDPRDTLEARATTVIWAVVLAILGGCSGKYHYFLFILPLIYLRWQRYRYADRTRTA